MAILPSAQTPPCERCGLPIVEAHYPDGRCPRPPRRSARRRVTLGVGGLAGLITFAVAAIVLAGLWPPARLVPPTGINKMIPAGPFRPMLQACDLFYRWEATGKTNLLNRAVADAWSPRVPSQSKVRFRPDFSGLRTWIREEKHAPSSDVPPPFINNYEHAIRRDCATSFGHPSSYLGLRPGN